MKLRESVVKIGSPVPLIGILAEPEEGIQSDCGLVLLNSGIMHRAGACRLSVSIARAAAEELGLPALRFDFSGIGDSAARRASGVDFDQNAVNEVREVLDHLQESRGLQRFIVYGLCSGALIACKAAVSDARIAAVVQIDGCCYPTRKSYWRYYKERLASASAWRQRLQRWTGRDRAPLDQQSILVGGRRDFEVPDFADDPGREAVLQQLQTLMQRGVKLQCVFTGRDPQFNYLDQYRECFSEVDFAENLSIQYFPDASHIFTEPVYRRQLVKGLLRWLEPQLAPKTS